MELEWTKTADGAYTALGAEEDTEQIVTLVIRNDKIQSNRPWTVRVSNSQVSRGLVGRERTLKAAKHLAYLYCTRGLNIEEE